MAKGNIGKKWYHLGDITKQFSIGEQPENWEKGMSEKFKKERFEKRKQTQIKKYGSLEEAAKKTRQNYEKTMLQKYGVTSNFKDPASLKKREKTWLEKYGTTNPNQNADIRNKTKNTCIEKYGVCTTLILPEIKEEITKNRIKKFGSIEKYKEDQKEKHKKSNLEKYGVESYFQTEEFKEKSNQTKIERYGSLEEAKKIQTQNAKNTFLEKYGVTNIFGSDKFKNEIMTEDKKLKRIEKSNETKLLNKSYNLSKEEKLLKEILIQKYGEDDVISPYLDDRYKDDNDYKFKCDFYIKSLDLFIELNLHWTHGKHPFDSNNKEDLITLQNWKEKAKTSKFFKNAIYTWTDLDVRKQKTAKQNNLNYITIYEKEILNEWKL